MIRPLSEVCAEAGEKGEDLEAIKTRKDNSFIFEVMKTQTPARGREAFCLYALEEQGLTCK